MHINQRLVTQLATSRALHVWADGCDSSTFAGTARIETRHTTYLFRNGTCFGVTHRDPSRAPSLGLLGMKIVGWLLPDDADEPDKDVRAGGMRVSRSWREGARAVLFHKKRAETDVALTSPTTSFTHVDATPAPKLDPLAHDTLTRINVPMAERASEIVPRLAAFHRPPLGAVEESWA
jgi:hypothetical protein